MDTPGCVGAVGIKMSMGYYGTDLYGIPNFRLHPPKYPWEHQKWFKTFDHAG